MGASFAATSWFLLILSQIATLQSDPVQTLTPLQIEYYELHQGYAKMDPEATMTVDQTIRYHGYPVEIHEVQTEDGYILTIHRIPHGKKGAGSSKGKPVIVQHGLLASSGMYISNTPDKNLPYILADEGYDVWITNVRGNDFGRKHVKLSPNSKEFWKFSFDEMAQYDMPAIVDYILRKTGSPQTFYIGHSMGITIAFAMLASKPEYNSKISGVMALAPAIFVGNAKSPIKFLAPYADDIGFLVTLLGSGEFLASNKILDFFSATLCNSDIKILCSSVIFVLCGFNLNQLNQTRLPVYFKTTPAGTSVQNIIHFAQEINSKKFAKHDFGFWENKAKYGQGTPPNYRLDNVKVPVGIFWGENDWLTVPEDVARLAKQLPNVVLNHKVADPKFSHLDPVWAIDVKSLVYDKLVSKMKELWKN